MDKSTRFVIELVMKLLGQVIGLAIALILVGIRFFFKWSLDKAKAKEAEYDQRRQLQPAPAPQQAAPQWQPKAVTPPPSAQKPVAAPPPKPSMPPPVSPHPHIPPQERLSDKPSPGLAPASPEVVEEFRKKVIALNRQIAISTYLDTSGAGGPVEDLKILPPQPVLPYDVPDGVLYLTNGSTFYQKAPYADELDEMVKAVQAHVSYVAFQEAKAKMDAELATMIDGIIAENTGLPFKMMPLPDGAIWLASANEIRKLAAS